MYIIKIIFIIMISFYLLFNLFIILFFQKLIKNYFLKNTKKFNARDLHTLFRSFFCFFISNISLIFSIIYWNKLINYPLEKKFFSSIINNLMLSYMIIDTGFFIINKETRIEIILHHVICIILFGFFDDKSILAFSSIGEMLSSFNWIAVLYPHHEWIVKLYKLYTIIFVRFFIWTFCLILINKYKWFNLLSYLIAIIFYLLDLYWASIIIFNFFKKYIFQQQNLLNITFFNKFK